MGSIEKYAKRFVAVETVDDIDRPAILIVPLRDALSVGFDVRGNLVGDPDFDELETVIDKAIDPSSN